MILYAPAKLNLYLKIRNKRPDGYHNVETIFERIALFDKIVLRSLKKNEIRFFCDNPEVPTGKNSLIRRAVDALRKKARVTKGAEINISKRIPVAAGLGGGSSDAASVLLGLHKMWKLSFGLAQLTELGKSLGADVPFFLNNISFALAKKRGDEIVPLKWKKTKFWHLLVYPPVKILSKDAYNMYLSSRTRNCHCEAPEAPKQSHEIASLRSQPSGLLRSLRSLAMTNVDKFMRNDLEPVVLKREPIVNRVKSALRRAGVKSLVSGSGPSVFSIFENKKEAIKAKSALIKSSPFVNNKGWRIFIVATA